MLDDFYEIYMTLINLEIQNNCGVYTKYIIIYCITVLEIPIKDIKKPISHGSPFIMLLVVW